MGTTSLYVEIVIIGLETMMWIISFFIYLTDIKYISLVENLLEKLPASIFILGMLYVLGLIIDRVADCFFNKVENKIRASSGFMTSSSILIWKKSDQEEYFKFTRSKIRILRASSINMPLLMLSIALNVFQYYGWQTSLFVFVIILGGILSGASLLGYMFTVKNYYNKAKILEIELKGREDAKQKS